MMALIGKEIRMTLRSLVFYLFVIASIFFYFTSYATEETWGALGPPVISKPQNMGTAEQPYYGWATPRDTRSLAEQMKIQMKRDLNAGVIEKIRLGFPMEVELDAGEKAALTAAISQLAKILKDPSQYSMDEVYRVAEALNSRLGGNSMYQQQGLDGYSYVIKSVDEAEKAQQAQLADYNAKVDAGELLPGAARYFSDYLSLPAGIFPVFLSAFLLLRDRSSRMNELIYSRRVSQWVYVGSKFIAQGIMLSLVYLILAVIGGWQTVDKLGLTGQTGQAISVFLSYTAWWLLPTLWISVAFGMFGSMLFRRGIVPIALQIIWWFVSVLPLMGSYGLNRLFIRFNSPNDYNLYQGWADEIALNRSIYLLLAVLLTAGAAWLWERNRSRMDSAQSLGRKKTKRTPAVPASGALR
ncbi:ABC transporter permease [Paenibacillus sp. FSL R7-269]|uniref:ABC transporter permease n=1 Tax=Paenibacillus sp. FSL R7-269 TaxID=1226755 RepID=UPI0003E29F49|nr:ABC transporter permease [Paenibacillus sp. FSL R7-269]ETT30230.1 ABC transporter permease [Paenibacillus sp. FSL R7-269]